MSFRPFYGISAVSASEVDIMLYGIIGWDEGTTDKKFVSDFKDLEKKYARINIRINSPGGSVDHGLPIFNVIKASKVDTHTYIDGIAYSMGALIALAGKTVHAAKTSLFMLHNVSSGAMGNAKEIRKTADEMDTYDQVLCELLADKTGKSLDDVKNEWLNYEDNFMTATEAQAAGFIDVIEDYDAKDIPENVQNLKINQVMAYYELPTETPAEEPAAPTVVQEEPTAPTQQQQIKNMKIFGSDYPVLNALAGKTDAIVTDENVAAINAELTEKGIKNLVVISGDHLAIANTNADAVTNGLTAINKVLGTGKEKTNLGEAITALLADLTAANAKVAQYGAQPGALGTQPKTAETEGGAAPTEGDGIIEEKVVNKFETSVDREVAARNLKLKS